MTMEERKIKIKEMTAEMLLKTYVWYTSHFNPIDDEFYNTYKMMEEEIIRRMEK